MLRRLALLLGALLALTFAGCARSADMDSILAWADGHSLVQEASVESLSNTYGRDGILLEAETSSLQNAQQFLSDYRDYASSHAGQIQRWHLRVSWAVEGGRSGVITAQDPTNDAAHWSLAQRELPEGVVGRWIGWGRGNDPSQAHTTIELLTDDVPGVSATLSAEMLGIDDAVEYRITDGDQVTLSMGTLADLNSAGHTLRAAQEAGIDFALQGYWVRVADDETVIRAAEVMTENPAGLILQAMDGGFIVTPSAAVREVLPHIAGGAVRGLELRLSELQGLQLFADSRDVCLDIAHAPPSIELPITLECRSGPVPFRLDKLTSVQIRDLREALEPLLETDLEHVRLYDGGIWLRVEREADAEAVFSAVRELWEDGSWNITAEEGRTIVHFTSFADGVATDIAGVDGTIRPDSDEARLVAAWDATR